MKIIQKTILVTVVFVLASKLSFSQVLNEGTFKIGRTMSLIDAFYLDTVNLDKLTETVIIDMLRNLDPHSTYISAKDVSDMNEPLQGNFEGIGIQFNLLKDTIIVIEPIGGGPSERVGLKAGDRIISIDGENVAGTGISTNGVRSRLLGQKGTKVNINVFRKGVKEILDFTITRDKIPINSLDASYMLDNEIGYVKLNKFALTTEKEFEDALGTLLDNNMKNMIIDLRNNGGGVMTAATDLANNFFSTKNLLVYIMGRKKPREDFKSSGGGILSFSKLVVLTDEGSASASEIFAGAMQDWDRGVVIGRRTFGKGLVQNAYYLTDGSMIRLSVARYYTPSGRLIQRSYNDGYEKYVTDFYLRYSNGEMMSADSIHFPDSLKYTTLINKRTVYGGGGIMPDIFVPADTSNYSDYYRSLVRNGILNSYILEYADKNRKKINSEYLTFDDFKERFEFTDEEIKDFIRQGETEGVKFDEEQYKHSEKEILMVLKALVANNIWTTNEYYRIVNDDDKTIEKALEIISDDNKYNTILGYR